MLPYRDSRLTRYALIIFFILLIGYGYFEARGLLSGPRIAVPSGTTEVQDRFVLIKGRAERIAELRMNGKPIAVTEEGMFEEPYLLAPGLNRIVLDAIDKYGRTRQEVVQIVFTGELEAQNPPESPSSNASSTATSTAP